MSAVAISLADLASLVGGEVRGDGALQITGVHALDQAGPEQIGFFNHAWYAEEFAASRAGAVIVEPGIARKHPGRTLLVVPNASLAFARISRHFHPDRPPQPGVAHEAFVHPDAQVDPTARIEAFAFIGAGAHIGARTRVMPFAYVGERARIGADGVLAPHAIVMHSCQLGDRVSLQPGVVIGGDGFGYALDLEEGRHLKVPQVGIVRIGDDVEVGANSAIDRATVGATQIGNGTKIDNLVQVGHNVTVGEMCILCGQVGLAGSCHLGDGVVLGGQAGVANHLHLGDGSKLVAQSGLGHDVPAGEIWAGTPSSPHRGWLRNQQAFTQLSELVAEVRRLKAEVAALKAQSSPPPASTKA